MTPKRIFIVEDQRLIAADLASTLGRLGYRVVGSVASGEEAVPTAVALRPDLILMDVRLRREMDGIQAAEAIRAQLDVPIVYLTAYADEATVSRARTTTPFGYVVKPFNERELRAAIEVALYKHEMDLRFAEERSRRRAAEEFKLLVDGVKDYAIFVLDLEGRVATWNDGARRIYGYEAQEVVGQHFSVLHPVELRRADEEYRPLIAQAIRDGRLEVNGWRVRKDGSRFWANVVLTALRDAEGRLHGFGNITRDLTEQRRSAQAVADRELLLRSFFNLAPVGMGILDASSGTFVRVNAKLEELTGYTAAELEQMTLLDLAAPDDPGRPDPWCEQVARLGGATAEHVVERRLRRKDGRQLWALTSAALIPSAEEPSTPARVALVLQDLTARKRMEDQLREAVRARDEFLQIASHELKTPLTPLQLQLDTLARALERSGVVNQRLTDKLETASRQTQRLTRLVESLLQVSRISAGHLALDLEPLDFGEMVRQVVDRYRPEARAAGCDLQLFSNGEMPGFWDHLKVEEILSKLLANAVKYGAGKPIEVEVQVRNGTVRASVTDHGMGIDSAALERIFGRFERAVSVRHFGGMGLGLFIARKFAEAHGGTLVAQSQPGRGSTFTLVLPRHPTARDGERARVEGQA